MNTARAFDVEVIVVDLMANRPSALDRAELAGEHVAWAISALEEHGLYPSLSLIVRVLGRGTQRTLIPLVNRLYRERQNAFDTRPVAPSDEAWRDLYDVVAKHARLELEREFASESRRIEEAQQTLEMRQLDSERMLATANELTRTAEALRDGVRKELDDGRIERALLQERLEHESKELAQTSQAITDVREQIKAVELDAANMECRNIELHQDALSLSAQTAAAEVRLAATTQELREVRSELEQQHLWVERTQRLLSITTGELREQKRRLIELTKSELRAENQLSEAQSKLARERSSKALIEVDIRAARAEILAAKRELRASQKALSHAENARDAAIAEISFLKTQLNLSARERRRGENRLLQVERANQRILRHLGSAPSSNATE